MCIVGIGRSLSERAAAGPAAGQRAAPERPCVSDPAAPAAEWEDAGRHPQPSGSGSAGGSSAGSGPLEEASARLFYDNPAFAASSSSHGGGGGGSLSASSDFHHPQSRAPDTKGKGKAPVVTGTHRMLCHRVGSL